MVEVPLKDWAETAVAKKAAAMTEKRILILV